MDTHKKRQIDQSRKREHVEGLLSRSATLNALGKMIFSTAINSVHQEQQIYESEASGQ